MEGYFHLVFSKSKISSIREQQFCQHAFSNFYTPKVNLGFRLFNFTVLQESN